MQAAADPCDVLSREGDALSLLGDALGALVGGAFHRAACEPLGPRVRRLRLETAGGHRSLIVKEVDPVVARRTRMLEQRWLPAVSLEALGPGLIASVADPDARHTWQIYEDWGDAGLEREPGSRRRVHVALRAIAELHLRFADHPLLAECRLWGGDLGMAFYAGQVRDALRALEALASASLALPRQVDEAGEALMAQLQRMLDEESARAEALEKLGGPETLVHGDLWLTNVFVLGEPGRAEARLIDWDHVGVSRFVYDLSTFLLRLPAEERSEAFAVYEKVVSERGWQLPDLEELNGLFDTVERARIASHVSWPALALLRKDAALRDWALEALPEVSRWFHALGPVLTSERREGSMAAATIPSR